MKTHSKLILLLFALALTFSGCKKEDPIPKVDDSTLKVNQFIKDAMDNWYLWNKQMPNIDIRYEEDPFAYFDKLLYKIDKWSFVTDNIQAFENSLQGKELTFGWSLGFGKFKDTGQIFALVEFVYPDTPAESAGLKRGDLIFKINNADITENNYTDLLYATNIACTYGQYNFDAKNIDNPKTVDMVSQEMELDPVLFPKIIEEGGHKIGYFMYAQFIGNFNNSIDTVLQHFVDEGIKDVIIDLRYNPGGTTDAAQHLCSSLAPLSDVESGNIIVNFQWNDQWQQYYDQHGILSQIELRFISSTVPVKMGLNKVYFLTANGTASASELSITGLMPYMEVKTVGDTTFGKYTASRTYKPEDIYTNESDYIDINNWGVQPIIARYYNSEHFTDFINGLYPDIQVADDPSSPIPLGDVNEPLLKAAIEDITGTVIVAKKRATIKPYTIFDRGFSRFDANKREVIINQPDIKFMTQ